MLENVTAGSKLDVIAPQNGSVKREQRYDGWRSYRRDSPTVSTLFIFIYTGLRFHASPLSLSLYLLFLLSFNLSCCIWSVQRVWYEIFSSLRSLLLSDRRNEPSKVFPTMPGCCCFCWLIKKKIRHFARKEWVNFCITSNNPFGYEVGNVHVVRWN